MKKLLYIALLIPFLVLSQNSTEYGVLENGMLIPSPTKIKEFEAGLAVHNKKYHGDGLYGARVYWISNGPNTGSYVWVMGPLPWSAMDNRPAQDGHDEDWASNVVPYIMPKGDQTYWKFEAALSNFPKDITIKNLLLDMYDVKRFKMKEAMLLLGKIKKVMVEKFPDETYGIYSNELPSTKDGRDITFVSFFGKWGWMGKDNEFSKKYDEVHGSGSFEKFLKDWEAVTDGSQSELWILRPDLSGISAEIKAATRQ